MGWSHSLQVQHFSWGSCFFPESDKNPAAPEETRTGRAKRVSSPGPGESGPFRAVGAAVFDTGASVAPGPTLSGVLVAAAGTGPLLAQTLPGELSLDLWVTQEENITNFLT